MIFNYQIERISLFNFNLKKLSDREKDYYKYFFLGIKHNLKFLRKKYKDCHLYEFENFQNLLNLQSIKIFKSLKEYSKKRKKWFLSQSQGKKNFEFIPSWMFIGSIGNYNTLFTLLLFYKFKLKKKKKLYCEIPANTKFNNYALASYFLKYVNLVKKKQTISSLKKELPLGTIIEMGNSFIRINEARNFVNQKIKKKQFKFKISKEHKIFGTKMLKNNGITVNDNEWFVTLHIRQYGWRGENKQNTNEKHRTPNPGNYIPAINEITERGGKVFLVGNNSFNFPKIKNFINYANSPIKSDKMDVYLAANSRFCIANLSGFWPIAKFFGTPVLLTDSPSHTNYLELDAKDMYLPRLIYQKKDYKKKNKLNLKMFEYPLNSLYSDTHFIRRNLNFIENTSEEIRQATVEMLQRGNNTKLQNKFKKKLNKVLKKNKQVAFANLPNHFLQHHF